jgi:hypothetical protein
VRQACAWSRFLDEPNIHGELKIDKSKAASMRDAIRDLEAEATIALSNTVDSQSAKCLAHSLWTAEVLVKRRGATPKAEADRARYLDEVASRLEPLDASAARALRRLHTTLLVIERGFAQILAQTKEVAGSSLAPVVQVSAALSFTASASTDMQRTLLERLMERGTLEVHSSLEVNEQRVNPDTEVFGLLRCSVATILMMAHQNSWLDAEGLVVLPESLSCLPSHDIPQIYGVLSCARAWLSWERAQTRIRFEQREIEELPRPWPPEVPEYLERVLNVLPDARVELDDHVANDRLLARTQQHMAEMLGREKSSKSYPGVDRQMKIIPEGVITFDEKFGYVTLCELYSFEVHEDKHRYGGLRLVEWLRGYAILMELARRAAEVVGIASSHECPQFDESELLKYLARGGLPVDRGRVFLRHCCLSSQRSDVYDRPLIKIKGDRYLLVAPAIGNGLLGPIVMSAVADSGDEVRKKGSAFEARVLNLLLRSGGRATALKRKVQRAEYDYDALLVWGDFCFMFECKNRSLSNGVLQRLYADRDDRRSYLAQVHRLVRGLLEHPEMLDDDVPEARGKLLVPCVISALPYAENGAVDGVYFCDYSSLRRFFTSPEIGQVSVGVGQGAKRVDRAEFFHMWSGAKPSPEDLLRHLEHPFQHFLVKSHTRVQRVLNGLGDREAVVVGEYARQDITPESGMAAAVAYGADFQVRSSSEWANLLGRIPAKAEG